MLTAALLWSSSGLFVKNQVFSDWSLTYRGGLLAFWRAVFATLVLVPAIRRPRWRWELLPLTLAFAAMNGAYLTSMTLTTAANAIWLQSTCPFWVCVLSAALFGQRPDRRELLPLAFALAGIGLIVAHEIQGQAMLGVTLGLCSGVFYALVVMFMARLSQEDSAWLVALCHGVAAVLLLPWAVWAGVLPSGRQFIVLAGFGVLQMAVPYLCLIRGLRWISSQEAVGLGLLEPVLMPIWVFLVGAETPAWWTIGGAGFILVGLVLRYTWLERAGCRN